MKVMAAIDSFKGCLSSSQLGLAAERGIKKVYPESEVILIPVADGGEGTVEALVDGTDGSIVTIRVNGPLMEPVLASYGISGDGKVAIIEISSASGLPLVPPEKRNPLKTSSFGTGELIGDAINRGCEKILVGIGGSATNDCGMGMLYALGYRFLDSTGQILTGKGEDLERVVTIDSSQRLPLLDKVFFSIACDVDNPLYGSRGAAYVYGRQKGGDDRIIERLDNGMKIFSALVEKEMNFNMNEITGAGAAGGMGGAFAAFLGAKLDKGIDMILEQTGLEEKLEGCDFVITGEGRIDFQSLMGKTPLGVAAAAKKKGIPVIALAGSVTDDAYDLHDHGIDALFSIINYPLSLEEALKEDRSLFFVEKNIEEIFRLIKLARV